MFSMNEIRQNTVHGSVELVKSLDGAVVVRVAQSFPHEPPMIENVVGHKRFLVRYVLLLHGAFAVGIDEPLMSDEITGIVQDEAPNAGSPLANGREMLLQFLVEIT